MATCGKIPFAASFAVFSAVLEEEFDFPLKNSSGLHPENTDIIEINSAALVAADTIRFPIIFLPPFDKTYRK